MPHLRRQPQWVQAAQCCLLEESSPGQHESVGALAGASLPAATGSWGGGMLASKPPSADRGRQPAKPCSVPALLPAWTKSVLCLA